MIKPWWNPRTITSFRKYGFYYRYDTADERDVLAKLRRVVMLKMNFFTPTKKPVGCGNRWAGAQATRV